jgi:hypothetical protein
LREDESRSLLALMQPSILKPTAGITLQLFGTAGFAGGRCFGGPPTASIDRVLARNVDAWLPDEKRCALRRLQNEMQMLLINRPTTSARHACQLPVTCSGSRALGFACRTGASPAVEKALNNTSWRACQRRAAWPSGFPGRLGWLCAGWAALEVADTAALLARQ